MLEALTDAGFALLLSYGLPVLFAVFVLKGAIVGKPLPTSVFLPGYVVAVSATGWELVVSVLTASAGYAFGQVLIYALARRGNVETIRSLPGVSLSEARLSRAETWFQRYSGVGIVATNLVPYVGTFVMIPAGVARYPAGRAVAYAFGSTVLNYVLIVWLVVGSARSLGLT